MKVTVKMPKEIEIRSVLIEIQPRYIGDSEDDDLPTSFPLLNDLKTMWVATVDVDTGMIHGWPQGEAREMHVKVCDAGRYSLIDSEGSVVAVLDGYVPNNLVPGSYGDYVELKIDGAGRITNWPERPSISEFFPDEDD